MRASLNSFYTGLYIPLSILPVVEISGNRENEISAAALNNQSVTVTSCVDNPGRAACYSPEIAMFPNVIIFSFDPGQLRRNKKGVSSLN